MQEARHDFLIMIRSPTHFHPSLGPMYKYMAHTSRLPIRPGGTENMAQKPNSFVHVEFHSNAPEKTRSFLENVFDWKFQDFPQMNYATFEAPSSPGGGLQQAENMPAGVLDYILSTDIENTLRKITSEGGKVVTPKMEIPGMGYFAVFQDPTGLTLALYEVQPPARPAARASTRKTAKRATRGSKKGSKRSR